VEFQVSTTYAWRDDRHHHGSFFLIWFFHPVNINVVRWWYIENETKLIGRVKSLKNRFFCAFCQIIRAYSIMDFSGYQVLPEPLVSTWDSYYQWFVHVQVEQSLRLIYLCYLKYKSYKFEQGRWMNSSTAVWKIYNFHMATISISKDKLKLVILQWSCWPVCTSKASIASYGTRESLSDRLRDSAEHFLMSCSKSKHLVFMSGFCRTQSSYFFMTAEQSLRIFTNEGTLVRDDSNGRPTISLLSFDTFC
jgi:hypothetical protein